MKGVKIFIIIYIGLKNFVERNNIINVFVIVVKVVCKLIDFIDVMLDY